MEWAQLCMTVLEISSGPAVGWDGNFTEAYFLSQPSFTEGYDISNILRSSIFGRILLQMV